MTDCHPTQSPVKVPESAVEAAARNMFALRVSEPDQSDDDWGDLPESWQEEWRGGARAALIAAAPDIAAQAWDECKHSEHTTDCRRHDWGCICPNPYRIEAGQ